MILPAPFSKDDHVLQIGSKVIKRDGDYTFVGEVVAIFPKRSGAMRIVVEDDRGLLLIMNGRMVEVV